MQKKREISKTVRELISTDALPMTARLLIKHHPKLHENFRSPCRKRGKNARFFSQIVFQAVTTDGDGMIVMMMGSIRFSMMTMTLYGT